MSMAGPGDRYPELRVSDQERERTVEALRAHTADGRLDLDEFSDRVAAVYAARTRAELDTITRDLPVPAPLPLVTTPAGSGRTTRILAILGGSRRTGRWRPGRRVRAVSIMGGSHIDLREAEFENDEVSIVAIGIMGGVHITVPVGMQVEFSGLPILGGADCKVPDPVGVAVGPRLRVKALAIMGGVHVRSRPPQSSGGRGRGGTELAPGSRDEDRGRDGWLDDDDDHRRAERQRRHQRSRDRHTGSRNGRRARPDGIGTLDGAGTVTVLFTDVVGFTELTERVGDERARDLLQLHARAVRAEVANHGGREVKATGDGFLVVFPSARQAVRCAAAIQRTLGRVDGALPVRIGLNSGDALHEGGDVLGFTVNVAARIADAAGPGEILVASVTRSLAGAVADVHFGDERSLELQGVSGVCHVHAVDWVDSGT